MPHIRFIRDTFPGEGETVHKTGDVAEVHWRRARAWVRRGAAVEFEPEPEPESVAEQVEEKVAAATTTVRKVLKRNTRRK